ncbi:aspartate aminotransferase family protein [Shumkonia mesophila]|uniref:aspartate aminotransferase family protein n=1 Tax=Shumkonia mesophila TaxID=2838854 RepID=UPI002935183E|nr:aspartate aminotransferase family protein [Shumkonia mesophila]
MPIPSPDAPLPNSTAARDIAYHLHGFTDLARHREAGPLVICRGEGVRVFDEAGNGYIEGMAGLWYASLGFSERRLAEAAHRQMERLPAYHTFSGRVPDVVAELAERLVGLAPAPLARAMFCNSGSEANDTAIKLIWQVNNLLGRPAKKKIVARTGAYHGVTIAAGSLSGLPFVHGGFDLPVPGFLHTTRPHHYREGTPGESEEAFASRCAEDLEKLILAEGPDTVAAFFAEPVIGAGGVVVPPATYFEKIQAVLKRHDVLLVADEVICGFGRTGNLWGCDTYGITPDILTTAKALSAGCAPIAAVLVSQAIYDVLLGSSERYGMLGHGFTYAGHPLSAAVALETLKIYEERDILGHVRAVAPHFQKGLRAFAGSPLVGEVRGVGLVGAVQLVKDKPARAFFDPKQRVGLYLIERAQAYGLITRSMADAIAFSPPLIISEAEIDEMLDAFGRAMQDTERWVAGGMPAV